MSITGTGKMARIGCTPQSGMQVADALKMINHVDGEVGEQR